MNYSDWLALFTFTFVGAFTPGPNNVMLMTSGVNVGFAKTIPHMLGVFFGFILMLVVISFGLLAIFQSNPKLVLILQIASTAYLFYLAYKIATSRANGNKNVQYKPMSFLAAANFQWINPKAWTMSLSGMSVYSTTFAHPQIISVFALSTMLSVVFWTATGEKLQNYLQNPRQLKFFNYTMATLLVLSVLVGFI